MKKISAFISLCVVALLIVGCDKDYVYEKGDYQYENKGLTYLENYNGILIHWADKVSDEQKEVIRDIASSMVLVENGSFTMGCADASAFADEAPAHQVTLSDYYLAKFPVTQKQWRVIMGYAMDWNGIYGAGDEFPATNISISDVDLFLKQLNQMSGLNFRKPTEAEWEFAARGGNSTHGYLYSGSNNADEVAWHQGNANQKLHQPGGLKANELGLYDMSGNIYEWCEDHYAPYPTEAQTNPTGPETGNGRVVRGGSISYEADYARVSARNHIPAETRSFVVGLRLAMTR